MSLENEMIIAGFAACGGAISIMWASLKAENAKLSERSDKCEKDREILFQKIAELTGDSELLGRCPAPKCPLRPNTSRVILRPVAPLAAMLCLALVTFAPPANAMWPFSHKPKAATVTHTEAQYQSLVAENTKLVAENTKLKDFKPGTPGVQHIVNHTDVPPVPPKSGFQKFCDGAGPLGGLMSATVGAVVSTVNILPAALALLKEAPGVVP